jgi:cell surface protein SprA
MPFFDWDRISITFQQTNSIRNSGVLGRPGFLNLFGRVPFFQGSLVENGPSLLYQLGLSSSPHGTVIVKAKPSFPFITGSTVPGVRAARGNLTDVFNQTNNFTTRTSRALWEGARVDLSWTLGWSYNTTRTIQTDSAGAPREVSRTTSGDVNRTFLTFPNTFIFKFFKTGVEDVSKRFEELKGNRGDTRGNEVKVIQAFEEGMEAMPISRKLISSLMPRPNWSFRWDGLEKMDLFSGFASRVTLDHAYTSTFRRRWRLSPTGAEITESEQVSYGFSPLVGLSITFKPLGKGNLTGTARYGTSTSTDLSPAIQSITETNTTDINISANYSRSGFEFPFFGLSLSNDVDVSFSYGYSKNNRRVFDLKKDFKKEGEPLEGTIRTSLEPRIRYILSARVTASIYYKQTKMKPDAGGSRIPGSTINEGGLDLRIQIQ